MTPKDLIRRQRLGNLCRNFPGMGQKRILLVVPKEESSDRKELLALVDYQPGVVVTAWRFLEERGYLKVTVVEGLLHELAKFCEKYGATLIEEQISGWSFGEKKKSPKSKSRGNIQAA